MKVTPKVSKMRGGGGGQGHFWTISKRKQLFSRDCFPNSNTSDCSNSSNRDSSNGGKSDSSNSDGSNSDSSYVDIY